MRTVTDYNFARDPAVPADGRVRHQLGHEPRAVPRRQRLSSAICAAGSASPPSPPAAASRRSAARRWRPPRPSRRVAYPEMRRFGYPQSLRHRRDRRRRHARHHDPALDRVRRLRPDHRAGHRQAVHRRHHSRPARRRRCTWSPSAIIGYVRPGFLPAGQRAPLAASGSRRCATSGRRCCCSPSSSAASTAACFTADRSGRRGRRRRLHHRRCAAAPVRAGHPAARCCEATRTAAAVFTVLIGALLFGYFLTITQTPQKVTEFLTGLGHRPLRRAGADHAHVSGARLPDGRAGHDHPDRPDHLPGDHAAGLRPDLVRRHHRHDGGARADPSARRHEHLRHQERGART